MKRFFHKGFVAIATGILFVAVTGLSFFGEWSYATLSVGLLSIIWGITWEWRSDVLPVSQSALTVLYWWARFCPEADKWLREHPLPTWNDAFHIQKQCLKKTKKR